MDSYVSEEDLENIENAEITISYLFIFINVCIIIIFLIILTKKQNIRALKIKFFLFFAIDIITRLFYIMTYYYSNKLLKEIFFSIMSASQFFLIISSLDQILDTKEFSFLASFTTKANPLELSILFFLFIFSYDKFSYSFSKYISFLQAILILICIYKLYNYLKLIILVIVEGINYNKNQNFLIYSFIKNLPFSSFQFFIGFHILKIMTLFVENTFYLIYMKIILVILKETSKYFAIFILGAILFILDNNLVIKNINKKKFNDVEERTNININ
jgi:hypothetical protein